MVFAQLRRARRDHADEHVVIVNDDVMTGATHPHTTTRDTLDVLNLDAGATRAHRVSSDRVSNRLRNHPRALQQQRRRDNDRAVRVAGQVNRCNHAAPYLSLASFAS
jgi:hypothetical protein